MLKQEIMAKKGNMRFSLKFSKKEMDAIRGRFYDLFQKEIDKATYRILYGVPGEDTPAGMPGVGNTPLGISPFQRERRKDLEAQLQQALEAEDYELCAKIRDQLNDCFNT